MNRFLNAVMVLMAITLAVAPIFTDCQSHGKFLTTADGRTVSMKCHWTGVAEVAAAVPLFLAGIFGLRNQHRETKRFSSLMGTASSLVAILIPTVLIGTCANEMMICNILMRPILLSAGIIGIVVSLAIFILDLKPLYTIAQTRA